MKCCRLITSLCLLTLLVPSGRVSARLPEPAREASTDVGRTEQRSEYLWHTVMPGETLGGLLNVLGLHPIWGPGGYAEQTTKLNPGLIAKNGNFLGTRKKILLPVKELASAPHYTVTNRGEVLVMWYPEASDHEPVVAKAAPKEEEVEVTDAPVANDALRSRNRIPAQESEQPVREEPFDRYSTVDVSPRLGFQQISAKDRAFSSRASIYSNAIFGVDLRWNQNLSSLLQTFIEFNVSKLSYMPSSPKPTIDSPSSKVGAGIGAGYQVANKLRWLNVLSLGQEQFVAGRSSSALAVDNVLQWKIFSGLDYRLAELKPYTIGVNGGGTLLMPSTSPTGYSVKLGFGYALKLYLEQLLGSDAKKGFRLKASAGITSDYQSTTSVDQTRTETSFGVGVAFGF